MQDNASRGFLVAKDVRFVTHFLIELFGSVSNLSFSAFAEGGERAAIYGEVQLSASPTLWTAVCLRFCKFSTFLQKFSYDTV